MGIRKKEEKLIVTFHTTADAIAVEQLCRACSMEGRMIPVPRELSAGCGLAWCTVPREEDRLREVLEREKIEWEEMARLLK